MIFKCKDGCSDCCGVVPINKLIAKLHESKRQGKVIEVLEFDSERIIPITSDMKCVFLDREKNECVIYEDRPDICEDYGVKDNLPCPYVKANGNLRSPAKARRMQRIINKDVEYKLGAIKNA